MAIPFPGSLQKIKGEKQKRTSGRVAAVVFQHAVAGVGVQNSAIRGQGALFAGAGNTQQDTYKEATSFSYAFAFSSIAAFSHARGILSPCP